MESKPKAKNRRAKQLPRAIELFAGVGGFRVGLNRIRSLENTLRERERERFNFVFANQFEPSTKRQDAFICYQTHFPDGENSNLDIAKVDKASIPDFDLLTAGFPCQDYSVARSLANEKGIEGKKGVLWWEINDILLTKKPKFALLENVDRLIKAPSKQRGRDFGIILHCLNQAGYGVLYKVINAADYGFPQRRRRVYIFAFRLDTAYGKKMSSIPAKQAIEEKGIFGKKFPIKPEGKLKEADLTAYGGLLALQEGFAFRFEDAGMMANGHIYTEKTTPIQEKPIALGEILEDVVDDQSLFLNERQIRKFAYLKGAKKIRRKAKNGHEYVYSEGPIANPDYLDRPSRTMLTSEGTINRSTHVVLDKQTEKPRLLSPRECERLNTFPDDWTAG